MRRIVLFFLFLALSLQAVSQGRIMGIVKEGNEPVPGAHVQVLNCKEVAVTNIQGEFLINGCDHEVILEITSIGFSDYRDTIHLHGNTEIQVLLTPMKQGLDEVVVTGNFEKVRRENSAVIVDVTGKEELSSIGANSLSDGIGFQSGLRLETNCQNCGFSQVRMNGLDGAYSQILINGKSAFSTVNNIYGLDQIPVELIEKVEVVKGGGSAIYGANAIAGTINVITKDPINNGFQINASSDAIGLEKLQYSLSGSGTYLSKNGKFGLVGIVSNRHRLEYDANNDGYSELPRLRNIGGSVKLFFKPTRLSRLGTEIRIMNEYRRGGDRINAVPHEASIAEELKSQVYGGEIDYEVYTKDAKNKFQIYGFIQKTIMDNYYGVGMDPLGYGLTEDLSWNAGFRYHRKFPSFGLGTAELSTGIESRASNMNDEKPGYGVFVHQNYFLFGGYSELNWQMHKKFSLIAGVRLDYQNITKELVVLPRAVLLFKPIKGLGIRASYARGFRAPQVFSEDVHVELVSGEIKRFQLSPDLRSEVSNSVNFSISYDLSFKKSVFSFSVDGFFNQIENPFILEQLDDPSLVGMIMEKRNGSKLRVYGFNVDLKYTWSERLILELGFTAQNGKYAEAIEWTEGMYTNNILRTPNIYGNYVFAYKPIDALSISTFGRLSGPMYVPHYAGDIAEDRLEKSPSYFDLGIKLEYTFKLPKYYSISIGAYVKNILNSYQSDFDRGMDRDAGYVHGPTLPRTIGISLKIGNL